MRHIIYHQERSWVLLISQDESSLFRFHTIAELMCKDSDTDMNRAVHASLIFLIVCNGFQTSFDYISYFKAYKCSSFCNSLLIVALNIFLVAPGFIGVMNRI